MAHEIAIIAFGRVKMAPTYHLLDDDDDDNALSALLCSLSH